MHKFNYYYGAILSKASLDILNEVLKAHTLSSDIAALLNSVFEENRLLLHHCTLLHSSQEDKEGFMSLKSYLDTKLNDLISFNVDAIGYSDKALAFRVVLEEDICLNKIPHITIATFNGGKPVDSNFIENWDSISPINCYATIKKFNYG